MTIAPVGKTRVKQVLQLFKERGIVRLEDAGRCITLLDCDASHDDFERLARSFRERDERDRLKQRSMRDYAEHRACRWDYLVNYFGKDDTRPPTPAGTATGVRPG